MKILLNQISKSFDGKYVFNNFSCELEDKKITVIKGESGRGKTTLLRIIAGLDKNFTGEILPKGYSVSVSFQEPRLFPGANVLENVALMSGKKDIKASADLLNDLGIKEKSLTLYPDELSGGMAARVSLARALLFEADLYLLDEPFNGLDEENIKKAVNTIKNRMRGKTCVIVTHNSFAAESLADNIITL